MALLLHEHQDDPGSTRHDFYFDRKNYSSYQQQVDALTKSGWLYVGNTSFNTTDSQLRTFFSQVGPVKNVIVGLNRLSKQPCGFAFVEYYSTEAARQSVSVLSGTMLDGRIIRCALDAGFKGGRQFGRGQTGGQVRDEKRNDHDPGRSSTSFASLLGSMPGEKRSRYERDTTEVSKDGDDSQRRRRRSEDEDEDEAHRRRPAQEAAEDDDDEEDDMGRSAKRRRRTDDEDDEGTAGAGAAAETLDPPKPPMETDE